MTTDRDREEALRSKLEMAIAQDDRGEFSNRSVMEIAAAVLAEDSPEDSRLGAIVADSLDFMDYEHDAAFRELSKR